MGNKLNVSFRAEPRKTEKTVSCTNNSTLVQSAKDYDPVSRLFIVRNLSCRWRWRQASSAKRNATQHAKTTDPLLEESGSSANQAMCLAHVTLLNTRRSLREVSEKQRNLPSNRPQALVARPLLCLRFLLYESSTMSD